MGTLIDFFNAGEDKTPGILKGRTLPCHASLPETGPVVIKSYRRGGMMSLITRDRYLKTGTSRPEKEFEFLIHAGKAGLNVPTPEIYATQGFLFYRAWLVTKKIENQISYTDLVLKNEKAALSLLSSISLNISLLIENRIHHVDLHPGNILIDKTRNIYIIDFDKACYSSKPKHWLIRQYQKRWARAVDKYRLPRALKQLELCV